MLVTQKASPRLSQGQDVSPPRLTQLTEGLPGHFLAAFHNASDVNEHLVTILTLCNSGDYVPNSVIVGLPGYQGDLSLLKTAN